MPGRASSRGRLLKRGGLSASGDYRTVLLSPSLWPKLAINTSDFESPRDHFRSPCHGTRTLNGHMAQLAG